MSEFKFACPVCGQHITCASGSSGSSMACPTCFRQLVVPQATAPGAPGLVLTASEVQSRTIPLPGNGGAETSPVVPLNRFPWAALALGLVVCLLAAGAFVFRGKIFHPHRTAERVRTNSTTSAPELFVAVRAPVETATNWTLNLAGARIPEAPAAGQVNGRLFGLQRATIKGGALDLRQGPKWPPDVGLSVNLFAKEAEDLAGKTVIIEATRTNAPRVVLRWKNEQGQPVTQDFHEGYALRVEFGSLAGKWLPGKIYVAVPDEGKSYAAGTFDAEIRKSSPPKPKPKP